MFLADRQNVRANCNLFIFFEQRGKDLMSINHDFFNNVELSYNDFANISLKIWEEDCNYIVIDKTKKKYGKLRINWEWRVLYFNYIHRALPMFGDQRRRPFQHD